MLFDLKLIHIKYIKSYIIPELFKLKKDFSVIDKFIVGINRFQCGHIL